MSTLVLSPRFSDDSINLRRAALGMGWEVVRPPGFRPPEGLDARAVVPYGEPMFVELVAQELGLMMLEPTWDWLPSLPEEYRLRAVRYTTLGEARAETGRVFVKPADEKCFPARVYASGAELPRPPGIAEGTPALVSEPVTWTVEYRCFVRDGVIAALSPYIRGGELARGADGDWPAQPGEADGARACCERLLADARVRVPPAVVVDVGWIEGRGWAVVEANVAWAAGLCGCDPEAVLPVLRRACVAPATLADADRPWVITREG